MRHTRPDYDYAPTDWRSLGLLALSVGIIALTFWAAEVAA